MSAMIQGPTGPPGRSEERFTLSIHRPREIAPRDGLGRLARILAKPSWTREDRDRLARARDGLGEHWCHAGDNCARCAMADRIDAQLREWDRIDKAPPIPSTAQLRRPAREDRARRLREKLKAMRWNRQTIVHARIKPYKTWRVRVRHEHIAECADPTMRRIDKAIARLDQIFSRGRENSLAR